MPLDVRRAGDFARLPRQPDAVIHAAAVSSDGQVSVAELAESNVTGTRNVIDYAAGSGAGQIIFVSSILVHGLVCDHELTAETAIHNPGPYGMSKRLGEMMLAERAGEIASISLRVPGILGPGAERHWLATVQDRARRGEDIDIYNSDGPFNNAVDALSLGGFIADLAAAPRSGAAVVPLGSAGATTVRAAAAAIIEETSSRSRLRVQDAPRPAYLINNEAALALGYRPLDIDAAIRNFARN